jgi:hypothetical protein
LTFEQGRALLQAWNGKDVTIRGFIALATIGETETVLSASLTGDAERWDLAIGGECWELRVSDSGGAYLNDDGSLHFSFGPGDLYIARTEETGDPKSHTNASTEHQFGPSR